MQLSADWLHASGGGDDLILAQEEYNVKTGYVILCFSFLMQYLVQMLTFSERGSLLSAFLYSRYTSQGNAN